MNKKQSVQLDNLRVEAAIKAMQSARASLIEASDELVKLWQQLGKAIDAFGDVEITGESWQIGDHELEEWEAVE